MNHLGSIISVGLLLSILLFPISGFASPGDASAGLESSTNVNISNPDHQGQFPADINHSSPAENSATTQAASFPFYDGFEDGDIAESWWTIETTKDGQVQVGTGYAYESTYSLLLNDSISDTTSSYADAILTVNLAGQSDVELDFWWYEFGEDTSADGVYISADSDGSWEQILWFYADPGGWRHQVIDLDSEIADAGIAYNDHFQIRFRFYNDGSIPNDGYSIDELQVRGKPVVTPASFPFYDGFESGALNDSWHTYFTNEGRIQVSDSHPYAGSYSLLLDDWRSDDITSYADAILTIDLAGQTQVVLDFWWYEFGEDTSADGVYISADSGGSWEQILWFYADPGGWRHQVIDLDAEIADAGIAYNDHFQIRFRFYNDQSILDDGYSIDDVQVHPKQIGTPASFPFYDGFETGSLSNNWHTYFTNEGRIQVSDSHPYAGSYSLLLDDWRSDDITSYADAILTIDLAGQTQVVLDFWWDEFGEDTSADGVYISADNGENWHQILWFYVDPGGWSNQVINLDTEIAEAGISYNDHFQIRFRFYNDQSIPDDGYAIDDVQVRKNNKPSLEWTGETNYTSDGLHPEIGDPSDNFDYHIQYRDVEGDPPGNVRIHILKGGQEISGSPYDLTCESGDYDVGVTCSYTKQALASGTDYSYYFSAQDEHGNSADLTPKINAPDVNSAVYLPYVANVTAPPAGAPLLEAISNPDGNYKFTVSWSEVGRATSYVLEQDRESTFTNPTIAYSGSDTSSLVAVRELGTFYFRVNAVNPFGESEWSNTQSTRVTVEPPKCPPAGRWSGKTNYGKPLDIFVKDTPSCYVDSVVLYFGICSGAYKITFYGDAGIVNNHFYTGGEDNYVSGDFISDTEAEGEFYLSEFCPTFPPMWVDLEGTWTATYNPAD